jgi:hypothetical protein
MAQALAAERIYRLNGQGIQRPEAPLRHPIKRPADDPARDGDEKQEEQRSQPGEHRDLIRYRPQPRRGDQGGYAEQQRRNRYQHQPG